MAKNKVQDGNVVTLLNSQLIAPQAFAHSGDPVVAGRLCGVALVTAVATSTPVSIDTHGVYKLTVASIHNGITVGETVYIDPTAATISDDNADVPFGVALGTVASLGSASIPVRLFGATPGASGANS